MKLSQAITLAFTLPSLVLGAPALVKEARKLEAADTDLGHDSAHWTVNARSVEPANTDLGYSTSHWIVNERAVEAADTDLGYGSAHWTVNERALDAAETDSGYASFKWGTGPHDAKRVLENADTDRNGDDKYWVKHKERSLDGAETDLYYRATGLSNGLWTTLSN